MQNPNSAIERIKNHLAYKLGQAMIEYNKNGGGYCHLFKKLYKIKKQHKKEQKIYQQTIQVFPQLKYPNLETCSDYEQALRYKFHLSYMLGEVLIKAGKTWYKGSGFKLKNDIKKAKKEFQIFKEILTEIKELNGKALKAIKDNQQFFLKEFLRIKNILKIHKNYQPILDNIFHNFDYFIQNFDLIEEWLLSNDFNERYKKENHPYPSLLDPKKLNDKNEKINYKNIPAELAWEMNLPLPDRYEFVMILKGCSGHTALSYFLLWSGYSPSIFKTSNLALVNPSIYYINKYQELNYFKDYKNILIFSHGMESKHQDGFKLFYLAMLTKDIYILTRDPLSRLKTWANHIIDDYISFDSNFSLDYDFNQELKWIKYAFGGEKVDLEYFMHCNPITNESMSIDSFFSEINYNKVFYIDFNEVFPEGIINLFEYFKDKYKFPIIQNSDFFNYNLGGSEGYLFSQPRILNIEDNNNSYKIFFFSSLRMYFIKNKNIDITKSLCPVHKNMQNELVDISQYFIDDYQYYKDFFIAMSQIEFEKLYQNNYLFNKVKTYIQYLCEIMIKQSSLEGKRKIKESDILLFFKKNDFYRKHLKNILDYELQQIKKHRPDIVASWKYYQEFEKMCKELDG